MDVELLLALLDQVELACGEEIAGPLRRAVRERDGALGMLRDTMPIEALRAVAEWAGEHPDIRVELVRFGGEFPTVNLRRTGQAWHQRAMRAWSSEEFRQAESIRDLIRDDLDSALRQIEHREQVSASELERVDEALWEFRNGRYVVLDPPPRGRIIDLRTGQTFLPGIESATETIGDVTVPVEYRWAPVQPRSRAELEAEFRSIGLEVFPEASPGEPESDA